MTLRTFRPRARAALGAGAPLPGVLLAAALLAAAALGGGAALGQSPGWNTHRGNPQRTGCADGLPGPASPDVAWVHRGGDHFVASPVAAPGGLVLSGLGAFGSSNIYSFAYDAAAPKRLLWSQGPPYLKLPIACAPAAAGGLLVFGDGMHQTQGALLHCLRGDTGLPLWQLALPGDLVHLEGAPTIVDGKVFIGGGNAGVLCVELHKAAFEGQEYDLPTIEKRLADAWKTLQAKYEEDKKKDPDFAVPPTADALPKHSPKILWRQGEGQWHVDAPVAVAGGLVLVGSAFLDVEKVGDRALFALKADTGEVAWRAPLKHNPWAGATVAGELALVGGSSIRFEPEAVSHGEGEVAALDLTTGAVKWQRKVTGGVVSSIAHAGGLAVFTATDGKARALDAATGRLKWSYDAKAPFFAAPAVAGDTVYLADLRGVAHAVSLASGAKLWTLDLAAEPVKTPGLVYGSPVVRGGKLYLATCNVAGEHANGATAVVCIGK